MELVSPERVMRLDPVIGAMGLEGGRKIWSPSRLSMREKAVLLLAGDIAVRELGLPFELHTAMALNKANMSVEDLRELLRHVAPAAGLNPTSRAFSSGCRFSCLHSGCSRYIGARLGRRLLPSSGSLAGDLLHRLCIGR